MIYPGLKIANYIIKDELGRGGFGTVYVAVEENSSREVAVKFLHPKTIRSEEARQAFLDEMINQAKLSTNPNIVQVIRSISYKDKQGEQLGMVMEYVRGDPLDFFIQKYTLLPESIAVPIFVQVLHGIGFAHRQNMLHRDIKPGNIMIGRDGTVKIMDFGLSKVIAASTAASESARAASLNYVAPERLARGKLDARTDIYSVGATLYEVLTGRPPYEIEYGDWDAAFQKHSSGRFPGIREFYDSHSAELDRIVRKALDPDPDGRYPTCEDMNRELIPLFSEKSAFPTASEEFLALASTTQRIIEGIFSQDASWGASFSREMERRETERLRRQEDEARFRRDEDERESSRRQEEIHRRREDAARQSGRLMASGAYEDALALLTQAMAADPSFDYAVENVGRLKSWIRARGDAEERAAAKKYREAAEALDKLAGEVPEGEGRNRIRARASDWREALGREIEILRGRYQEAGEIGEKAEILDQLIRISPPQAVAKLSEERERIGQEMRKKKSKLTLALLGVGLAAVAAVVMFAVVLPGMQFRKNITRARGMIGSDPAAALRLLGELQKKKDSPMIRDLLEQARLSDKTLRSRPYLDGAERFASAGEFESAFLEIAKAKQDVFRATEVTREFSQKENDLKRRAADHYLRRARDEADPGEKFFYYQTASDYLPGDRSIPNEAAGFLGANREAIAASLVSQARRLQDSDCKKARRLIELCFSKVKTSDEIAGLRETIYRKCR